MESPDDAWSLNLKLTHHADLYKPTNILQHVKKAPQNSECVGGLVVAGGRRLV